MLEHHQGNVPHLGNVLAFTDNSSCVSWLYRSNFDDRSQPINAEISTRLARTCIDQSFTIHSQHIRGLDNKLADALSRLHHLSDDDLTDFAVSQFPSQTPRNLRICPVPPEILSWVSSTIALGQPSSVPKPKPVTTKWTDVGRGGNRSWHRKTSSTTRSSTVSDRPPDLTSAGHSSPPSETASSPQRHDDPVRLEDKIKTNYLAGLCGKPLATWLRNSGAITGQAPFMCTTSPTCWSDPSTNCSKPGSTRTPDRTET